MPIYGEEKVREIIRGILPSTARKGARENARHIHRSHRSNMSQDLRRYRGCRADEAFEAFEDDRTDYEYFPDGALRYNMWDRRESDKLAALLRWGPKLVEDVRLLDRESKLRSILPDNVIGRHALGHLKFLDDIAPRYPHEYYYYGGRYTRPKINPFVAYVDARDKLVGVLAKKGEHKRFNNYLKAQIFENPAHEEGDPVRTFRGEHDIDQFLKDCFGGYRVNRYGRLLRNGETHAVWGEVAMNYLDLSYDEVDGIRRWADEDDKPH